MEENVEWVFFSEHSVLFWLLWPPEQLRGMHVQSSPQQCSVGRNKLPN